MQASALRDWLPPLIVGGSPRFRTCPHVLDGIQKTACAWRATKNPDQIHGKLAIGAPRPVRATRDHRAIGFGLRAMTERCDGPTIAAFEGSGMRPFSRPMCLCRSKTTCSAGSVTNDSGHFARTACNAGWSSIDVAAQSAAIN